ncbi:hypothetical protein BJY16_005350 [Actinoplanes octamycinicus]|uniref:Uncharacterized protein n=1 Tax=Actinoplanes octamycinicus TaxID=135948 RepID=A0A7W7H0T0_9ACTN|nr:hypothetical protein [Actinoplanes octamycinicus]MBB4741891.1 hypothetical protein [Actinoplanes octamycinicus]GIE60654.1 hypothetical protein Aoc01nite_60560 [Actinoplanes octamycinicus]
MSSENRMTTVARLWAEHCAAPFPGRLRAVEVAGVEMVMLDADVAGCVSVWLANGGTVDDRSWDVLAACERRLERVLPELTDREAAYYRRLLEMTVLVLDAPG